MGLQTDLQNIFKLIKIVQSQDYDDPSWKEILKDGKGEGTDIDFHSLKVVRKLAIQVFDKEGKNGRRTQDMANKLRGCVSKSLIYVQQIVEGFSVFHNWNEDELKLLFSFLTTKLKNTSAKLAWNHDNFSNQWKLVPKDLAKLVQINKPTKVAVIENCLIQIRRTFNNKKRVHLMSIRSFISEQQLSGIMYLCPLVAHFLAIPAESEIILIPHLTSSVIENSKVKGVRHYILFIGFVKEKEIRIFDPNVDENLKYVSDANCIAEVLSIINLGYNTAKYDPNFRWKVNPIPIVGTHQASSSLDCGPCILYNIVQIFKNYEDLILLPIKYIKHDSNNLWDPQKWVPFRSLLANMINGVNSNIFM